MDIYFDKAVRASMFVAVLFSVPVAADSIVTDNIRYDDVYIRTGTFFYYVCVPETGAIVNVDRAAAPNGSVTFTADPDGRAALLERWKKRRAETAAPEAETKPQATVVSTVTAEDRATGPEPKRTLESPTVPFLNARGERQWWWRPWGRRGRRQ